MSTSVSKLIPIDITAGVCPATDCTPSSTPHFTDADKIRFVKGYPQKIGGWMSILLNGSTLEGTIRSIYSSIITNKVSTVLGSNTKLYSVLGSESVNITPFDTTSPVAVANSLDTHYATLANDPITTTSGSLTLTIADTEADKFVAGDLVTLAGATATGGVPAVEINKEHIVRSIGVSSFTIKVLTEATSAVSGGGAAVVRSSGLVTVNSTAHTLVNGDRVSISGATTFGGITTGEINAEHLIRNVATNTFDVMTGDTATSSVSGAGGAGTQYLVAIAVGLEDQRSGQGYGMGKYGVGLYGTALVSDGALQYPRIWFLDSYGDAIITTPGAQGGVYTWDGNTDIAPALVPNAPTAVNYSFISDNMLVTFGAGGVVNKIFNSDQGDIEQWTASSTNQVFEDNIEGAGALLTHANVDGVNLIFTNTQCYTFSYIGLPNIWDIEFKENIGIISPMARVVVKGVAYWIGQDNFYMWRGGNIEVIPSNTSSETTLLRYVFEDINRTQQSKSFAWYNKRYDEIWFHYPSAESNEVDRIARYHVTDRHWTPDTMDRLAAEYPTINLQNPRLISSANVFYRHEIGTDDDVTAMAWSLKSNYRDFGTNNVLTSSIIPDSVQTGNISFRIQAFSYPQSPAAKSTKTVTVTPTSEFIPLDADGRFLQYTLSGGALGQKWIMGRWLEPTQRSARSQ